MTKNRFAGGLRAAPIVAALALTAGCVDLDLGISGHTAHETRTRTFSYDCGGGGHLSVESHGASVLVTDPAGEAIELPAAPPAQQNRYGRDAYALVIGDGEALWMKAGKRPVTCRR